MPSHESEALEDKQKLQMKTFRELAECLARIPPKITFYGLLFKYNYVGCLLLLMFSSYLLFAIKRDAYIFRKQDDFVGFRSIRGPKSRRFAGEKRQTFWPKLHTETEYESQITAINSVLDQINSVALEGIVRGTLAELSKNLMISLSLRNN